MTLNLYFISICCHWYDTCTQYIFNKPWLLKPMWPYIACDVYMPLHESKMEIIPHLAASKAAVIMYLFIEVKAWFIVAVSFACQKITRDNLALVTRHYPRQWNTRDSCVTPLWNKHKGHALEQCRLSNYYCHTKPQSPAGPHRWHSMSWLKKKGHVKQIINNKYVHFCGDTCRGLASLLIRESRNN